MPEAVGLTYCFRESKLKPVVLRSAGIKVYMERDGMTYDEANEYWEYNMAGTDSMLIAVDDMLSQEEIADILEEQRADEQRDM